MVVRRTVQGLAARLTNVIMVAAVLALPGCVDPDDAAPAAATESSGGSESEDGAPSEGLAAARFRLDAPVVKELWFNGTFSVHQNTWPVGQHFWMLGQQPPGLILVDISQHVPRDVPVRLISDVHADLDHGRLGTWFSTPFEEHWSGVWEQTSGGDVRADVIVVHASSEPVTANLIYGDVDPQPTFDYTWRVRIEAHPDLVPSGVAVELEVPDAARTIQVQLTPAGEEPAILLWDAEDRFVGRFDMEGESFVHEIASDAARGSWVVMLAAGSGVGRIHVGGVDDSEVRFETVVQDIVAQDPQERTGQNLEWTFESERVPLQAGFSIQAGGVTMDLHATLTGPAGPLLEAEFTGGPWVSQVNGFGSWHFTPMGAPGLVSGTYRANVEFGMAQGSEPHETQDFLVYYAR